MMKEQKRHSPETIEFIRQNIDKLRYSEIGEALGISRGAVNQLCIRNGIKKTVTLSPRHTSHLGYHVYSSEEDQWTLQNACEYHSIPKLARAFNAHFGTDIKEHALEMHFRDIGICKAMMKPYPKKQKPIREPKPKKVKPPKVPKEPLYSEEEELWMKQNISRDETYAELTEAFNKIFGRSVTMTSFSERCRKLGLRRDSDGRFVSGNSYRTLPILQEVERDGYVWVKIADDNTIGAWKTNWVQKHRYVYEHTYGKIPKDHIVIFLDGDKHNFDPENLYCISRAISVRMSQNKWFTDSREHTLTAIRLCELMQTLQQDKGG